MAERAGCHGCDNAQWDADGCTCRIDGLLVWNPAKGCKYRICDEKPEPVSEDYERGFKDGIKSECLKELTPFMVELVNGCTEAIKGIAPMLIDKAQLTIRPSVNRWIPCIERLPETIEPVIFSVERGYKQVCCGYRYGKHRMWKDRISGLHYTDYDVIAWMPMPDAYEPPEEGDNDA